MIFYSRLCNYSIMYPLVCWTILPRSSTIWSTWIIKLINHLVLLLLSSIHPWTNYYGVFQKACMRSAKSLFTFILLMFIITSKWNATLTVKLLINMYFNYFSAPYRVFFPENLQQYYHHFHHLHSQLLQHKQTKMFIQSKFLCSREVSI